MCGVGPSLSNSDVKPWPGLTPTLDDSQFIKGEGQKECHELEQRLFQTIKPQAAPYELRCGRESGPLLAKNQRPKCMALLLPLDTEGGDGPLEAIPGELLALF